MTVAPDTLLAFVEGELSPEEAKRVAAEVACDPSLAAHMENHRALKERLRAAAMAPGGMTQTASTEPMVLTEAVSQRPAAQIAPRVASSLIPAGAMAAGVVLGALLWGSVTPEADIRNDGGSISAGGTLSRALSNVTRSDRNNAAFSPFVIGDSFFSSEGLFCRDFKTGQADKGGLSGIACREDDVWRIRVLAGAAQDGGKEQPIPEAVRNMLNVLMVGSPLDEAGERAARAQGWVVK